MSTLAAEAVAEAAAVVDGEEEEAVRVAEAACRGPREEVAHARQEEVLRGLPVEVVVPDPRGEVVARGLRVEEMFPGLPAAECRALPHDLLAVNRVRAVAGCHRLLRSVLPVAIVPPPAAAVPHNSHRAIAQVRPIAHRSSRRVRVVRIAPVAARPIVLPNNRHARVV